MSEIIAKLGKLKHTDSFMQINTTKGFKYIDRAGEIVNRYCRDDNTPPQFNMSLKELHIIKPVLKINDLKITPQYIWAHFIEIDTLDSISNIFLREAKDILQVLDVKQINRIGWRNYFVCEFKDEEEQKQYLSKFNVLDCFQVVDMRFKIKTDGKFNANLGIQPVTKNDTTKTFGILFDIDLYKNQNFSQENIDEILLEYRKYLSEKDGLLKILNGTFK